MKPSRWMNVNTHTHTHTHTHISEMDKNTEKNIFVFAIIAFDLVAANSDY